MEHPENFEPDDGDSHADALAAVALVLIFTATAFFWLSSL